MLRLLKRVFTDSNAIQGLMYFHMIGWYRNFDIHFFENNLFMPSSLTVRPWLLQQQLIACDFYICGSHISVWASCQICNMMGCACAGLPGTLSPSPQVSDPDMDHGTSVTHVPWSIPGLLISGFIWSRWRGKRSRLSRRVRNTSYYLSGKRPMTIILSNVVIFSIKIEA